MLHGVAAFCRAACDRGTAVDEHSPSQQGAGTLRGILGYLNFSAGKPDARFQKQFDEAWAAFATRKGDAPWQALRDALRAELRDLHTANVSPFQDVAQAEAVLGLIFDHLLPAYRHHHEDLLFHQTDGDLFQPGFLIRACEAVLAQSAPWDEPDRIVGGALAQLNDYVGYRPIAVLETRRRGEPYDHERLRTIPLMLGGVGVLHGRYHALLTRA